MEVIRELNRLFNRRQKKQLVGIFFLILIGGFFEMLSVSMMLPVVSAMVTPQIIYEVIDRLPQLAALVDRLGLRDPQRMILTLVAGLIIIYIIKNLFLLIQVYCQQTFITRARNDLISRVLREFLERPYEAYLEADIPTAFRLTDSDIPKTFSLLMAALSLCTELVVSLLLCAVLIRVNWMMTAFIFVLFLLLTLANAKVLKPRLEEIGRRDLATSSRIAKWRIEAIYGLKDVKVLNRQDFFIRNYYASGRIGAGLARSYAVLNNVPRLLIETIFIVSVLAFIAVYILAGGDIQVLVPQLMTFALAAVRIMPSANRINTYLTEIAFERPSLDYVCENLPDDLKEMSEGEADAGEAASKPALRLTDRIELKNISFRYPNTETQIFSHASMTVRRGESVGIMGTTGAGKSTIVDILLGLLHAQEGEILCDGVSIFRNYDAWLAQIGYIPQSIYLVDESIRDNIAFGIDADQISDERIWEVLREAQLADFVRSLPEQLETKIGDRGVRLSGGQRQRIGIARALYHDPEILVFDEATSALDNETERALMEAINGFHGRKTMVIIAHRLNTIAGCDRVYEVRDQGLYETKLPQGDAV
ncbi:MAG: ABC transporter ATP-binding protein [Butyrivibrio sp.]|nr:ABC transporter ATP-binding protein [Butyrivibrio sp.]